jgi:D-alanyl-D-alanine carboxypeptidase
VRTVKVSFLFFLVILILLNGTTAYSLAVNRVLQEAPADDRQIILVKIVGSGGYETMKVSFDDLVLDVAGCTYEPADKASPFIIGKNVLIAADNIILADTVIDGDLYINAGNAALRDLDVNGTIYIDPDSGRGLKLDNVTSDNVAIWTGHRTGAGNSDTDSEKDNGGDDADEAGAGDEDIMGNHDDPVNRAQYGGAENDAAGNPGAQNAGNGTGKNAAVKSTGAGNPPAGNVAFNKAAAGGNKAFRAYMQVADTDDLDSDFVVVNKTRHLPADFRPKDLVKLQVKYNGRTVARYMRKEAADALARLFVDAAMEGIDLCAVSGYRSYSLQEIVFNNHKNELGLEAAMRVSALPGQSEHQTGLAIDISSRSMNYDLDKSFAHTREGKWLAENAPKYGFILRYPEGKESITGYDYEPWHFRYVGRDAAMDITKKGLTLEEYFGVVETDTGTEAETGTETETETET